MKNKVLAYLSGHGELPPVKPSVSLESQIQDAIEGLDSNEATALGLTFGFNQFVSDFASSEESIKATRKMLKQLATNDPVAAEKFIKSLSQLSDSLRDLSQISDDLNV
ncbi:MAG TPA: hypothetical protein ENI23_00710 [bacterium]|nr:hypothetical protein [bacterium]